ncbi:lytic transglycosylase domain-containing protein [Phenylobacterium sp. J367]|uniref:lytic transglycosylase domain-containing protein n=1 Tax=Phenylobacterium sp. J367 TaxID=2898435 RepID=UPI002150E7BD|nr:lytic transglycosylase domain-containing protein [Phenylobacterium sp. J367]MCR5880190.1 lytic transglycosylase domain-containing protein [Phenylobacterium sp. J367]
MLPSAEAAAQSPPPRIEVGGAIAEAAQRFGLPEAWIRAVMRVESAFQPRAVSHAGAMGLMQVMPQTYAELRGRYGLGADPFHPRDNILAGAAYLREMYDRFGARGFLAAYNAGPARYQQHLIEGRPLPLETRAYVAKLTPAVGGAEVSPRRRRSFRPPRRRGRRSSSPSAHARQQRSGPLRLSLRRCSARRSLRSSRR